MAQTRESDCLGFPWSLNYHVASCKSSIHLWWKTREKEVRSTYRVLGSVAA